MKRLALVLTTALILVSFLLAGCNGVITQEQYDAIVAQFSQAQEQLAKLQGEAQSLQDAAQTLQDAAKKLQEAKEAADAALSTVQAELAAAQAKIAGLEAQISSLKDMYELVGATPAETAENIVRYYHETHVYSIYDLFVCSDMASEVWNMLKAKGISAVIVVGNKDEAISDILESNHAWVLADVGSGEKLALETTGGFVVTKDDNPLYYRGWSFETPRELKSHNELVREYNVRVSIRNQINDEANAVAQEHNQATNPTTADKLEAVYDKLVEIREQMEAELNSIKAELDSLATRCGT